MDHNDVIDIDIGAGTTAPSGDDLGVDRPLVDYVTGDSSPSLSRVPSAHTDGTAFPGRSGIGEFYLPEGDLHDLEPSKGMYFESEEAAKAFYNSYARRIGFSTRVSSSRRSRRDGAIIQRMFVCAMEGFRNSNEKRTRDREIKRPRKLTRTGCRASITVKMKEAGKWVVCGFVREHNHELLPPDRVHILRSHRQISGPAKTLIDTLQAAGMGPRKIMSALIREYGGISKVGFTEVDCRNYMRFNRQSSLECDVQILLDYLRQMRAENPSFFYVVEGDGDNQGLSNVFWADSRAQLNYTYFGDTVTFDTTYRSNKYRLPFAPFTGVNHHGQPVLFGCAFVANESQASFVWLFRTWLMAMSGRPPVSITTDYDTVVGAAIAEVFPDIRHRFCKWHIFKKCQEKLSQVFLEHPTFEAELHKCVNFSESVEEFESCWLPLIERYGLTENEWLQTVYSARGHWVPAYLRNTFFAEMSITQRSDGMNSYFDGYINASTGLNHLFKLYQKAVDCRNEKEVKADFDTMNIPPVRRTPSPMEKQASELYTKSLFTRFQEELVGTLTYMASKVEDDNQIVTYQVCKYGEDHKAYHVKFNILEMKASCSCQMFEFSGLLCRHVMAVFRVNNVLTLPPQYILRRWTRNAKSSITLEIPAKNVFTNYLESHAVRYNTLRHEAFKFIEQGLESADVYGVAMSALGEAAKKVASALKGEGKASVVNGHAGEHSGHGMILTDRQSNRDQSTASHVLSEEEKDRRIRELTHDLEAAKMKCDAYRSNLLSLLKEIEDHKQQLAAEVQIVRSSMRDCL
ncbi:hypothetical protein MLD38_032277 [Melastoma candidum]|uniref:Uncharacterized protein n=1 Tax=Melastoma candidum TaxID=119954 RepID=A0ACB9M4Z7_9MYRT|nr:hypothetical protein MLD38_032277 [Melastoma candidum]